MQRQTKSNACNNEGSLAQRIAYYEKCYHNLNHVRESFHGDAQVFFDVADVFRQKWNLCKYRCVSTGKPKELSANCIGDHILRRQLYICISRIRYRSGNLNKKGQSKDSV